MTLTLFLGFACVAGAVPLLWLGALRAVGTRGTRREAIRYLSDDPTAPEPAPGGASSRLLAALGARLTPAGRVDAIRALLGRSGKRWALHQVLAAKAAGGLTGALLGLWVANAKPALGLLVALLAASGGFRAPEIALRRAADSRAKAIRRELSDSLDLLAIAVEAGAGLEGALAASADDLEGPLGDEYRRVLHEMRLGASRREALLALKRRVDVPEVSGFVLALLQADAMGTAISKVLRNQAGEMRARRRRWAREQAAKTPVKILFPLVFAIFPAVLVVVLGPAVIRILEVLGP